MSADVIVVGGGLVGGLFACALAEKGLQVIVVERQAMPISSHDGRTSAIAYGSAQFLRQVGVWQMLTCSPCPIQHIRVSQKNSSYVLAYEAPDKDTPLGFMVPNRYLHQAIIERSQHFSNLRWKFLETIQSLEKNPFGVKVALSSGEVIQSSLLVAADGRFSSIRQQEKSKVFETSYPQKALIFNIQHTNPHHNTAFEHFLPSGPLAVLPLQNNNAAIVWSDNPQRVDELVKIEERYLLEAFVNRFGEGLGACRVTSPRWSYPLGVLASCHLVSERVAYIGDAAHVMHPVAGQGFNVGLRDAQVLAHLIHEQAFLGLDFGKDTTLKTYQRHRRLDVLSMTAATDGLIRLFSVDALRPLRTMGTKIVSHLPFVKNRIRHYAMGL